MAADALGRRDLAIRDYTLALEKDPRLTAAQLNRGILWYKTGRFTDAITDFQRALLTSSDATTIGHIHFNLALAYQARGDVAKAIASADQAIAGGDEEARALRQRLQGEH